MSYLTFIEPVYLWFLLAIPLIYIAYKVAIRKKHKAALKFSNVGLIKQATSKKHNIRNHLNFYLSILIIALMILAFTEIGRAHV